MPILDAVESHCRSVAFYLHCWLLTCGIDVGKMLRALDFIPGYLRSRVQFRRLQDVETCEWHASLIGHVLNLAREQFDLQGLAFVDDAGDFHSIAVVDTVDATCHLNCGCGIFELRKKTL